MRNYELMYVIRPLADEELNPVIERVHGYVTNLGGQVLEVNQTSPYGRRRLAYQIDDNQDGYYVLTNLSIDPQQTEQLERDIKFTDDVLRHLLTKQEH